MAVCKFCIVLTRQELNCIVMRLQTLRLPIAAAESSHRGSSLWVAKLYYLFFFGALGALAPFFNVYLRERGLSGAEIGVILLLFMLGLEYSGEELGENLRSGFPAGIVDFLLNFPPGLILGLLLGWSPLAAVLLGGVTYISSSGVIAKVLSELGRMNNRETPTIISILVLEDLIMAVYLPIVAVLLIGQEISQAVLSVSIALATVGTVLFVAVKYGKKFSKLIAHQSDEVILLTTFGLMLFVAGMAQSLQVSAAIGAFLMGIAISDSIAERTHKLLGPSRDLFAAIFFLFFGLQIDPASLPPVLLLAVSLGIFTTLTKIPVSYTHLTLPTSDLV